MLHLIFCWGEPKTEKGLPCGFRQQGPVGEEGLRHSVERRQSS